MRVCRPLLPCFELSTSYITFFDSSRDYKIFEVLHSNIWGSSITRGAEPTWKIFVPRARIPVGLRAILGFGGFDARTTMLRCNATVGRLPPCKQACGWKRTSTRVRANSSGSDVSVFRFTLGNEVADQQVARFVGGVGAFLLLLNRLDTSDASLTDAQRRAEGAGAWLSACCLVCPAVDERLRQTRRKGASAPLLRGASNAFVLDRDGNVDASFLQEVAWCTFAVLRCTEAKAVLVGVDGRAVLARGLLQETSMSERDVDRLQEATNTLKKASEWRGETNAIGYLSSAASLRRVGAYEWPLVPTGARSLWTSDSSYTKVGSSASGSKEDVYSITAREKGHDVALLVYSDVPLPPKQRLWLSFVMKKLHSSCPGFPFNARSRVT